VCGWILQGVILRKALLPLCQGGFVLLVNS
jgi:hypothetical protein